MRRIFVILLALFAISCTKLANNKGTVVFALQDTDVQVVTKAISSQQKDDFTISIPNSSFTAAKYGSIKNNPIYLTADSYTAQAENCTEDESVAANGGYGKIRYFGQSAFTVEPMTNTNVSIVCSVANAKASVMLSNNFISYFDKESTTVKISLSADSDNRPLLFNNFTVLTDSNGAAVAMEDDSNSKYAYYNAGDKLYITVKTKKISAQEFVEYSLPAQFINVSAATWNKINIDANVNSLSGGIKITVNGTESSINNGFSIDGYVDSSVSEDE